MRNDNEEWSKIFGGTDLSVENGHGEFNKFWPEPSKMGWKSLMSYFRPQYIMSKLSLMVLRTFKNLKENWPVLSKMTWRIWQIFVHRLKNSDFILESKMAELNKNKNSKEPDRSGTVWKNYFALKINE